MAHLTIVTKRSSMTQWPIQRNVYTLVPPPPPPPQNQTRASTGSSNTYDDSLTNLSWLHDMHIVKRTIPTINSSSSTNHSEINLVNNKRKEFATTTTNTSNSLISSIGAVYPNDIDDNHDLPIQNDDDDEQWKTYRTNPQAKPVYSYSQLILLAMRQSGHEKMTLQMIYEWVADNFPYFKKMEPTWQNSIRHNLSLNKCFIKVPRTKREAGGKGGFWKLSTDFQRQQSITNDKQSNSISSSNKRIRSSKRVNQISDLIKNESWLDPILQCQTDRPASYIRMPSSFLSPVSSPDPLTIPPFNHQQSFHEFSSVLTPSPSTSPSSMSSKQNFLSTKLDETDMLLLDSVSFDWDAYLNETPNDIDVQPLLSNKTEQDLFNDFNAALTDLTYSAEAAAAAVGDDSTAFDGFDYSTKNSTFQSLFEDEQDDYEQIQSQILTIKGRGIKRPACCLNIDSLTQTKLPSLETAFDLKLSK